MHSICLTFLAAASAIGLASCAPTSKSSQYDLRTIQQFPSMTWIENMAIRYNGQIMANDISKGKIFLVDPEHPTASPPVVAQFPNGTYITGIAEVQQDVFYTQSVGGDLYHFQFAPNTSSVWEVDMRQHATTGKAAVRKVVDMPEARTLNGMTLLSEKDGTILMADSELGVIWKLNVKTGAYEVVFDHPLLQPVATDTPPFGVNGVHIAGSTLYFTNTNHGLLAKYPISPSGHPAGPVTNISTALPNADDFAVDSCGNVWLCENVANTLVRVSPDGQVETVAGGANSSALIGPVSARFGRGAHDRNVLYIGTDGLVIDAGGIEASNGKIAAINTDEP